MPANRLNKMRVYKRSFLSVKYIIKKLLIFRRTIRFQKWISHNSNFRRYWHCHKDERKEIRIESGNRWN